MSKLPQVTGDRLVRALLRAGFVEVRRHGSHAILRHRADPTRWATIPVHGSKPIPPGTLRAILRGARISVEELIGLV